MTALPSASTFTGSGVTEADFKTQLTNLISYLSGLLDTPGTTISALQKLGALGNAVLAKGAAYTVVATDRGKLIDCTTGTWTLTLTAAATLGSFAFAVRNSGSGTITIDPNLSEQIDGASTIALAAGESCVVVCDGTAFKTIGKSTGYTAGNNISIAGNVISAGGWRQVGNPVSVTAVASIDFDLQEDIYGAWMFVVNGVIPATDGAYLLMRPGYSGGTVFDSANGFAHYLLGSKIKTSDVNASNGYTVIGAIGSAPGYAEGGVGTAAGEHAHALITIGGLGSALAGGFAYESKCGFVDDGNNARQDVIIGGYRPGNAERLWDSVRFLWSAGSFEAAGTITMYGLPR